MSIPTPSNSHYDFISSFSITIEHIIAGVIGFLIIEFILYLYHKFKRFLSLLRLKTVFPVTLSNRKMAIKCSIVEKMDGKIKPSIRAYVHSAETLGLQLIAKSLQDTPLKLKFDSFYSIPNEPQNLLLIGAGAYNQLSKNIMKHMGPISIKYSTMNHAYFLWKDRAAYHCCHNTLTKSNRVTKDYGVILKKPHPDGGYEVLLMGGIHMHGTLAAAQVALSTAFQYRVLRSRYKYFVQLVEVFVYDDGFTVNMESINWKKYPLQKVS